MTADAHEQSYFAGGTRFWSFVDISVETMDALIHLLKKRYTSAQLKALTTLIVDNNHVERLWTRCVPHTCVRACVCLGQFVRPSVRACVRWRVCAQLR